MSTPTDAVFSMPQHHEINEQSAAVNNTNQNNQNEAQRRQYDELEGTLLPVAQQIHDNSDTDNDDNNAMAAVPVEVFDYDEALRNEQEQLIQPDDDEQEYSQHRQQAPPYYQQQDDDEQIAYTIPIQNGYNMQSIADDSFGKIKNAQHRGIILSEEEKDAIRKASGKIYSQNYFETQALKHANEIAKRRDREGLQVPPHTGNSSTESSSSSSAAQHKYKAKKEEDKADGESHVGGYQVEEYQIADENYDTEEYDVKEYKSVYD